MDIKDGLDFYLKIIPALSSPGWEYTGDTSLHDVIAWHRLKLSDPDIEIRGRIGIQNTGIIPHYFVQLESGEGDNPAFTITAPLQLALFESYTKPIIQPTFEELDWEALKVAYELIGQNRARWIENREEYPGQKRSPYNPNILFLYTDID